MVSYSLYTEREKNSGKTGAAPAGRRGTRPWEVDGLLQIGICDDARESRFQLRVLLERALEGRSAPARLLEFSSGDALLGWMDRHAGELDLVFLDIEMEGTNGMDTARALREADQSLQLVFVTGYSDYVFDGYEVGALGYLLKPAGRRNWRRSSPERWPPSSGRRRSSSSAAAVRCSTASGGTPSCTSAQTGGR